MRIPINSMMRSLQKAKEDFDDFTETVLDEIHFRKVMDTYDQMSEIKKSRL